MNLSTSLLAARASLATVSGRVRAHLRGRHGLQRALAGGLLLVAGLGVSGLLIATTPSTPADPPEEKAWPVSVQMVEPAVRVPRLSVYGRVEAAATTRLEAPLSAPVAEVLVRPGQRVAAGDLLVRLDDTDARLALREQEALAEDARAQLESIRNAADLAQRTAGEHEAVAAIAAARLERYESLFEQHMVARGQLDEVRQAASQARIEIEARRSALADFPNRIARAEAQLHRAQVAADRARVELARTRVTAPFPGPVLAVNVARGDQVMAGTPLLDLVDETSMELRVPIPADRAADLRAGLADGGGIEAEAELDGTRRLLPLARMSGQQKDGSSVVDAYFTLAADSGAQVGQVVDVGVRLPAQADLIAVPVQALYENERIYRIDDDRLVAMPARVVGEADGDAGYRVLVRVPGLAAGTRIITTQLPRAITGLKVAPVGERVAGAPAPPVAGAG